MTQTNLNHKVGRLIIVDDEVELMTALCEILSSHGYETAGYTSAAEALAKLKEQDFDLLLTDLMMPEMDGIELLQAALAIDPDIVGIVMTGQGTVQTAVEAMKTGALDYIMKPFKLNGLLPVLSRAMEVRHLKTENFQLRETVAMHELGQALAFTSDLNQILDKVTDAAMQQYDADEASIMLPTSDGKELIIAVARGGHTEHIGKRIPMGQGIAGWVAHNREAVTLSGEVHDERFTSVNPRADIRAAVSIPLLVGGNLVGVLNINITHSHRPFTLGQIKTLNMLVTIVSPILENARLYAEKKRAEDLYRTLAEGSLAVVFIVQDGKFRFINSAVASVGYSAEELIGRPYDAIIHPEDREMVKKRGRELLRGEHTTPYEYRIVNKQGQIRWLMQIVSPILHEGRPAILGNATDITERKLAEEALKESENKYRLLADNVNDVIFVLDMNLNYTYVSPSVKILRGYEPEEVLKQPAIETLTPSSRDLAMRTLSEIIELEKSEHGDISISRTLQLEMMRKDGTTVWTEVKFSFIRDEDQRLVGILGVTRDITERKREVEELRSYSAEISDLYNNAPCGYHSLAPDGTFLRMNDTELQWFGYTRDEIIGKKKFSDITTPESRQLFQEMYPAFKERGWAGNLEFDVIRKDGTILPVLLNATAVKDADGNYIMSRSTTFDNTEHQRTEEELRRDRERLEVMVGIRTNELASKNAELEELRAAAVSASQAKSDFLASMSHELRTPLNAIIGFSDVLLDTYFGALNEKQKEYMMDILESGKHLLNLINDILDISKVEAGKMELELAPVEIGNLLASCVVMIKEKTHKHGIDLTVDIPKELLAFEMFADQRKIKQIVFNLLSNAAKFTPDGGAITLSALRTLQEGNDVLEVSVMDTGIGIPPEYQEKIFENFYQIRGGLTDKTPGTGLGLSVSKQLVELHGGGILLKSEGTGRGSQFTFTLPVKAN